jgi:hypothetical protein
LLSEGTVPYGTKISGLVCFFCQIYDPFWAKGRNEQLVSPVVIAQGYDPSKPFIQYRTVLLAVFLHGGPSHSIPETRVVDPDPDWIRIQRLCGSGSVLGIRIQGQEKGTFLVILKQKLYH